MDWVVPGPEVFPADRAALCVLQDIREILHEVAFGIKVLARVAIHEHPTLFAELVKTTEGQGSIGNEHQKS